METISCNGIKKKAVKNRQTGTTTKKLDKQRSALPPGKRKSRTGRTYYERRKNRSDAQNSLTGIKKGVEEQLQKALWKYEKAKTVKETKAAREQIKKYRAILNKL